MKQPFVNTMFDFIASRMPLHKLDVRHMITEKEVPVHRMSAGDTTSAVLAAVLFHHPSLHGDDALILL
ncbi:MAG: hypothetical protein IPH10_11270 [bacterium]|nr:hypothetical protein [bacterium]